MPSIERIVREVTSGKETISDRVQCFLQRIERLNHLNAFISLFPDYAFAQAERIQNKLQEGEAPGALTGTVVAVKDNILMTEGRTTCASAMLDAFEAPYQATVIERLEAEGAIVIGKTNMDEFAMGSSNETSWYGPVANPYDKGYVPGGSSGGSAAAVAAGLCDFALGSETGGSIRQPAAFTGIVGLKPSYGRVSRYGLVAYASSLDQIGVMTANVEDAARVLRVIAGPDANDATSAPVAVPDYRSLLEPNVSGMTFGLPASYFDEALDPEIKKAVIAATESLQSAGVHIKEIALPDTDQTLAAYYILAAAEASSNLARYDGVRFGFRKQSAEGLDAMYRETRGSGFGSEVRRRIMLGTFVLASGYHEAYYQKAQNARRYLKQQIERVFQNCDFIISATTPTPAFRLGALLQDPVRMYQNDRYTVAANLAGICAVNVPLAYHSGGLPIGLQLWAPAFREERLLRAANFIQKECSQVTIPNRN